MRYLKVILTILAVLLTLNIVKDYLPQEAQAQVRGEIIRAKGFVLEDENRIVRGILTLIEGRPYLVFRDENGMHRACLAVTSEGPYLRLWDENQEIRANLAVTKYRPGLGLSDENEEEEPFLSFFDENRKLLWSAP